MGGQQWEGAEKREGLELGKDVEGGDGTKWGGVGIGETVGGKGALQRC